MQTTQQATPATSGWYYFDHADCWRWFCATTQRWSWAVSEWMLQGAMEESPMTVHRLGVQPWGWSQKPVPAWVQALNHI